MERHRKYLADRLLCEEQTVTYRLLSRALKVHVNKAKEMLYEYHQFQNQQKPSSIYATYLLIGEKSSSEHSSKDEDVDVSSSSPEGQPDSDYVNPTIMTLVSEEKLEDVLTAYESVSSIHVYSLAPHPQRDLALLSEVSRSVIDNYAGENPMTRGELYGSIVNPNAKVRPRTNGATPIPKASVPVVKPKPTPTQEETSKSSQAVKNAKQQESASKASTPSSTSSRPPPSLKKTASGGIMQSFARAAANSPKPKPEPKQEPIDTEMALSDDGEADEEDLPVKKVEPKDEEELTKTRKERQDALKRMMEESDDDDALEEQVDDEMEEAPEPEAEEASPPEKEKEEGPQEVVSSVDGGRRRGRRRVMKKRRIQDDEGFMVTIQEQAWESFSEDESTQSSKKSSQNMAGTPQSSANSKKGSSKTGQGSIMSFFQKR